LSNTCHSVRQALPIFPSIAILAAIAVERVSSAVRFRSSIAVIAVIVALPSLVRAIALDRLLTQKDTRVDALEFLANSGIPPQQVVGVGFYGLPRSSCIAVRPPFMDWVDAVHRRRVLTRESAATLKPRLLIRDLSSGLVDEFAWVDFASIAETEYDVVLRGEGRRDGATPELPDLIHGTPFHFIPYANPWTMTRPGPSYVIYERR
jgi:hypothetical protein